MQHERQRVRRACQTCRRKKLKCDGDDPCERCRTQCIRCQYAAWQPLRGDDEPTAFDQLAARMDSMEKMFMQFRDELGAIVSAAGSSVRAQQDAQEETILESGTSLSPQREPGASNSRTIHYADGFGELSPDVYGSLRYVGLGSTASVVDRCEGLRRHIDESLMGKGYQAWETFLTSPRSVDGEPLLRDVTARATEALKADEQLVDTLLSAYFDRMGFMFPVVTTQEVRYMKDQLMVQDDASLPFVLPSVGKSAILFALLATATSLLPARDNEFSQDRECRERPTLFYGLAVEMADIASRAKPPGDLLDVVVAKALLGLYLAGIGSQADAWIVIGEAIRRGQDIGLHRSSKRLKLPLDETNKRKHIWWCLFVLEVQLSAALGRPMSIDDGECDVELPSQDPAGDPNQTETGFVSIVQLHQVLKRILKTINSTQIRLSLRDTDKHALLSSMIQEHHSALETWAKDQVPLEVRTATSGPLATVRAVNLSFFYVSILLLYRIFLPHPHRTSALERSTTQMTCAKNALYCIQSTDFILRHNVAGTFLICHAQHIFVSALVLLQCVRSSQEVSTVEKWYQGAETACKQLHAMEEQYEGSRKCRAIVEEYLELTKLMQRGVYAKGICNFSHLDHPSHAPATRRLSTEAQLEPRANPDWRHAAQDPSKRRRLTASTSAELPRWVGPVADTPSRVLPPMDLTASAADMLRTYDRSREVPLPSPPRGPESPQRLNNVCGAGASDLSHGSWEDVLNTFSPDFTDLSLLDPLLNPHLSWLDFSQSEGMM